MNAKKLIVGGAGMLLALAGGLAQAAEISLYEVQFPERRTVEMVLKASSQAPSAKIQAKVTYRDAQAGIVIAFSSMKPAILFNGDVTSYVVWAVTRDGSSENLGELVVDKPDGKWEYATALKGFALLITAEPYYLVGKPSALIMFHSTQPEAKGVTGAEFVFDRLAPEPRHALDTIAHIRWDSDVPFELLQAEKAFELATKSGAADFAAGVYAEAGEALETAKQLAHKDKKMLDNSRRSVALSNIAINVARHTQESRALEASLARRRAEMADLEKRAAAAESRAQQAEATASEAASELAVAQRDLAAVDAESLRLAFETEKLRQESAALQKSMAALQQEKQGLERTTQELEVERSNLSDRLHDALSKVADTRQTARGFIVSLPDILFDLNEATLRHEAEVIVAKIAGILLVMDEIGIRVEGHTDSTGTKSYNDQLSGRRAETVAGLMAEHGVPGARLQAQGMGMDHPVADNATAEGRRQNRRVEIILAEGGAAN